MVDFVHVTQAQLVTFLLVLARCTSMLFAFPIFSARQIPHQVRVAIALIVSFLIFHTVPLVSIETLGGLVTAVVSQVVLGLVVGYVAQLVFVGAQFAGEVIDIQIGFAVANVISPTTQQQVTVVGDFEVVLATLLFLAGDAHLLLLQGIDGSFHLLPLPFIALAPSVAGSVAMFLQQAFLMVFQIAAPPAVALFITNVALGLMARVAPQMNVFVVGFPLQIGAGLLVLAAGIPLLGAVLPEIFGRIPVQMDAVMRGMMPP